MTYCKNCGKQQNAGDSFCQYCGRTTNNQLSQTSTQATVASNVSGTDRVSNAQRKYDSPVAFKDARKAKYIAILTGFIGLIGIAHLYIGLRLKGIILLFAGFGLSTVSAIVLFSGQVVPSILIDIPYVILWIWHIFDVKKQASAFNLRLHDGGEKLW
jgi:hypothetical protein